MIFDKIENITQYNDKLTFIVEDLKKVFSKGQREIDNSECFCIGLEYLTQHVSEGLWESHRVYLDVHVLIEGEEIIHISDITKMNPTNEYQHDYQLFDGPPQQYIHLTKGHFLVLFPNEVHRTSITVDTPVTVKKNVYKIKL